jgi:hypothetical protein
MSEPRFETVIPAHGSDGNIFEIVGKARVLMRNLGLSRAEIEAFTAEVAATNTYQDARAVVRRYFRIDPPLEDEE